MARRKFATLKSFLNYIGVEGDRTTSSRALIWLCRYRGQWSAYLLTITWAIKPAPAMQRSIGRLGAAAWVTVWH